MIGPKGVILAKEKQCLFLGGGVDPTGYCWNLPSGNPDLAKQ